MIDHDQQYLIELDGNKSEDQTLEVVFHLHTLQLFAF
jgi:hypothetical protein